MIKEVPHGYDNRAQFNMEQRNMLGRDWNTEELYESINKP